MATDNRRRRTAGRTGLGEFLRARRARVTPAEVGLAPGPGLRRTPGLRREELAAVAGVSVDYYIRLEQGKESRPSAAVLDALARALRLDGDARAHLRALAEQAVRHSSAPRPAPGRTVRPVLRRMLTSLLPAPAYVLSRTSDILAANPPGLRLFAGLGDWPAERRNTIRYIFLHPAARALFPQWELVAAQSVAHLRTVAGTDPDAPDLTALVGELVVKSDEFATMWRRYDVRIKATGRKEYEHPEVGRFGLDYEVLSPAHADGQRLVAYQAEPGTPDHDAMLLLALTVDQDDAVHQTGAADQTDQTDQVGAIDRVDHPRPADRVDHADAADPFDHLGTADRVGHTGTTDRVGHTGTADRQASSAAGAPGAGRAVGPGPSTEQARPADG